MIETQNFDKYPVFGEAASKTAPDAAKYSAGFLPADVLPAEWLNWAWAKNSKGISDLNAGVTAMEAEINAVLDSGGIVPDNTAKQLIAAIKTIILQQTGTLTNLHTANKETIVAACNELLTEIRKEVRNREDALQNAKALLQQSINTESQNLFSAIQNSMKFNTNAINKEKQEREATDKALDMAITYHKNNRTNPHGVTAKQIGLERVNNTPDNEKRVKYAESAGVAKAKGGDADTVGGYHAGGGVGMLVPVVAFDCGETSGYIKLGNGLIVNFGKVKDGEKVIFGLSYKRSAMVIVSRVADSPHDKSSCGASVRPLYGEVGSNIKTGCFIHFSNTENSGHYIAIGF